MLNGILWNFDTCLELSCIIIKRRPKATLSLTDYHCIQSSNPVYDYGQRSAAYCAAQPRLTESTQLPYPTTTRPLCAVR